MKRSSGEGVRRTGIAGVAWCEAGDSRSIRLQGTAKSATLSLHLPCRRLQNVKMTLLAETPSAAAIERVLIVEDDPAARSGLEQLIRSWGFAADSAADGEDALEKVTSFRPAIVISDL